MKIKMKVKSINSDYTWDEEYDVETGIDAKDYAEKLIINYNTTLRPHEVARELVDVIVVDENSEVIHQHNWEKQNLVTIVRGNSIYDTMKCSMCGITGKRYGLVGIQRDSKYKAKCYDTCEGAIKQMNKLKK
jgi:hypothetical protein